MARIQPDRVVVEARRGGALGDVLATSPEAACRRLGHDPIVAVEILRLRVAFVRNDGWTLAAQEGDAADAFSTWASTWAAVLHLNPDGTIARAESPEDFRESLRAGAYGPRGLWVIRALDGRTY